MATTTFHEYNGNGSLTTFAFTFPTFKEAEVIVEVDDVIKTASTHYNLASYTTANGGNVVFTSGNLPGTGVKNVRIYRDTDVDAAKASYTAGSSVKAGDLNNNQLQALRSLQEEQNQLITTLKIKDAAVTRDKIKDDAINGTKIADDSIDSEHYIAASIDHEHLANDIIDGDNIQDDVINSEHYAAGSIDHEHLANDIIDGDNIQDDVINSEHIAAGAVDLEHMSANSVGNAQYVDGSIDLIHLSANSVDSSKIVDGSIVDADIKSDAAIAGTKISTNFGSLNLTTSGSLSAGATTVSGNITVSGTVDGRDVAADGTKLDGIESNATADQTATEIKTLYESNSNTNAYVDAHNTLVGGITATSSELNILDGKTFKTSSGSLDSTSDTEIPSSKVINTRIVAVADQIGGFVPVADKDNFPTSNPDPSSGAGTVVSLSDAAGISVNSSGVGSLATRAGGSDAVIINGFPSSMRGGATHGPTGRQVTNANPYIIPSGVGLLVQTTTTAHTYTYHKVQPTESDVVTLNDTVEDFQQRYRIGNTNPAGTQHDGDLFYNTNTNKMLVYRGDTSAWEDIATTGNYFTTTLTSVGSSSDTIPGGNNQFDGTAKKFGIDLTGDQVPRNAFQITVSVNGVIQKPNAGSTVPSEGYAWDSANSWLIFADAIPSGTPYFIIVSGSQVNSTAVQPNEVGLAELEHLTEGDILVYGSSGTPAALGKDAGKFLKSNASGAPSWEADTDTTYTHTWVDSSNDAILRLTAGGSGSGNDDLKLVAGTNVTLTPSGDDLTIATATQSDENFTTALKNKLDGIEASATADQTNAEIRSAVEAATDSNVFTDADHSKLNGIETSATADQTDAEIRAAVEAATDSNVFTDADHTKLNGIEASATADQTGAEIKSAYEGEADTNAFTDADHTKLDGIATGATKTPTTTEGDIIYRGASADSRLAKGTAGQVLKMNSGATAPEWGTDNTYSSALTTQGDILYRDGSGDQRLAKGTAGQVLKMNSGATAPEWGSDSTTTTFLGLTDTPGSMGSAGQHIKVNSSGNALEFVAAPSGTTNLSNTANGTSLTVESSSGNNTALPAATTSAWGVMTDEDKTKLDGIATGATATPTTTRGDIIYRGASADQRLAKGSAGQVLKMGANDPEWGAASVGTITALNNQAANRLTTIGSTTTELDGEANLTFDGTDLTVAAGGAVVSSIYENPKTLTANHTIGTDNNAMVAGPFSVGSATLTIPSGSVFTVI